MSTATFAGNVDGRTPPVVTVVVVGGGSVGGSAVWRGTSSISAVRGGGGGTGRLRGRSTLRTERNFDALVEGIRAMVAAGSANDPDIHNRAG